MNREISILQYNVHLFGKMAYLNWFGLDHDDEKRTEYIINAILDTNTDLICLEEVWDNNLAEKIIIECKSKYKYCYRPIEKNWDGCGSGLLFLSQYKIIQSKFFAFEKLAGVDYFVRKGFISSIIEVEDNKWIGIFITHTQSPGSINNNEVIRLNNIQQLTSQILNFKKENPNIPIIVSGDLNVIAEKGNKRTNEYITMNKCFSMVNLNDCYRYFWPSIIHYPGYTWTWFNTMSRIFSPNSDILERIDYIYATKNLNPILILTDPESDISIFNNNYKMNNGEDLSDHYPLYCKFKLPKTPTTASSIISTFSRIGNRSSLS